MRSLVDGTRIQDSKFVQGLFWATVFAPSLGAGGFVLPDDPESTYVLTGTGGAAHNITLPRLIGNVAFGGQSGLTAAQVTSGVLNGLWLELVNAQTVAGNTLQAQNAAGDGGGNVGTAIAVATSATQFTTGQYQVINGVWVRII